MKRIILSAAILSLVATSAIAGTIKPGETATCKDASSISIEVAKIGSQFGDANGYTSNDRGGANLAVWKSSNFTTVPITLGPNDNNASMVGTDGGRTGLPSIGGMGQSKVVLKHETSFSRGDSIGDISGTVKLTNTGANPVTVTCN
jgi:hypothetical protein